MDLELHLNELEPGIFQEKIAVLTMEEVLIIQKKTKKMDPFIGEFFRIKPCYTYYPYFFRREMGTVFMNEVLVLKSLIGDSRWSSLMKTLLSDCRSDCLVTKWD